MTVREAILRTLIAGLLFTMAGEAQAGIINPGFETGDLAGWVFLPGPWSVGSGGGSEGLHYATLVSPPAPDLGGYWIDHGGWAAAIEQVFTLPVSAETLSVDVWTDEGIYVTIDLAHPDWQSTQHIEMTQGTVSQAPNGFRRYLADVSAYAGLSVRLTMNVWSTEAPPYVLGADAPPPKYAFLDNVQVVPEPATLMLLVAGALFVVVGGRKENKLTGGMATQRRVVMPPHRDLCHAPRN
jgi:hypothetical protein